MILLKACFLGLLIGFLYDLFRVTRKLLALGKIATFILDLCFSFFAALFTLLFLIAVNSGQFRAFILLGEAAGLWLYFNSLSVFILMLCEILARFIQKALRILWKIICVLFSPFRKLSGWILTRLKKPVLPLKNKLRNLKKNKRNRRLHLKRHKRIVYNEENNS